MKEIAKLEFTAELVSESSLNPRAEELGAHKNCMTLFSHGKDLPGYATIEWAYWRVEDPEDCAEVTQIGIWFDAEKNLTDYDGVFSLPIEAVGLLESAGFTVDEEFR